jgi:hypothetical protein
VTAAKNRNSWDHLQNHVPVKKILWKTQEKKEILRNPGRNIFFGPKNKFLKTGICNLGRFGGIEPQKRVEAELIEWRSVDLNSINSKSTFGPPQGNKHMGAYSACILGVRLRYRRHGKNVY